MSTVEETNHKAFIKECVQSDVVWGLLVDDNWAVSPSTEYEDAEVLLFWSTKDAAVNCATEDWSDYKPQSVKLTEFIAEWLPGMYDEGIAVGTNWTNDLEGVEIDPLSLALELVGEMIEQKSTWVPEGYNSLSEFEAALMEQGEDL